MQFKAVCPLLVFALLAPASAAFLRVDSDLALETAVREARAWQASSDAEWSELKVVEADENKFWVAQLDSTEAQLHALAKAANVSLPQGKAGTTGRKPGVVSQAMAHLRLNPKTTADLIPALAMLKGMYENTKASIEALNKREQKSKAFFADKEAEHNQRLARIESKNSTLSTEFRANETRDETRLFTYWKNVRERQHHGFHTNLKIQHGMMNKVKTMMDMYEKTISGGEKAKEKVQKELQQEAAPEVVFIQVGKFCSEALMVVQQQRRQMLGQ